MLRSLRSRLIVASVLWTAGLLAAMHMASMLFLHVFPSMRGISVGTVALSGMLMAWGFLVARYSLTPFGRIRAGLASIVRGESRRVEGSYPVEVQPLINEVNSLLEDRESAVKRALMTAGDLAHGLKTPLALLAQEAERLAAEGNAEAAETIHRQVERMSRQVNYHLARARATASGAAGASRCAIAPSAEALVRTLQRLYASRSLTIAAEIAADLSARVEREDLEEMLGNLLDNAWKWARAEIRLTAARSEATIVLLVDDDGSGLEPGQREAVMQRGVRLDEAAPGSGLGLGIVRDLAHVYGGSITLEDSPLGGLRARLTLPA